jgi:hypothetical protein
LRRQVAKNLMVRVHMVEAALEERAEGRARISAAQKGRMGEG